MFHLTSNQVLGNEYPQVTDYESPFPPYWRGSRTWHLIPTTGYQVSGQPASRRAGTSGQMVVSTLIASQYPPSALPYWPVRGWIESRALCLWTLTRLPSQEVWIRQGPSDPRLVASYVPSLGASAVRMQRGDTTIAMKAQPAAISGAVAVYTNPRITRSNQSSE
jgi:hypothetical protein